MLVLKGRFRRKVGIPVLLYHSVDRSQSVISISPSEFGAHMEYLKHSGYHTISSQEFFEYLHRDTKPPAKKTVFLTFDDGFKNNYTEAFPVLQQYGFTATIFLATDHIGGICRWDKDESIPEIPLLSWKEIQEMSDRGIDFGSHGCSHAHLTELSRSAIRIELQKSKSLIEEKLNKPVIFFCHPYGETSRVTRQEAKECGYLGAFGGLDFGLANTKHKMYDLTRLGTAHFSSLEDFKAGLLGTYGYYIRIKQLMFWSHGQVKR